MGAVDPFLKSFSGWARAVRGRLLLRQVLSGLALGLLFGAAVSGMLWWQGLGHLRPWASGVGLVGAGLAAVAAWRRRWSDQEIALFLDARFRGEEVICTALQLANGLTPTAHQVKQEALRILNRATGRELGISPVRRLHSLGPLGVGLLAWVSLIPLPPSKVDPSVAPGADRIQGETLAGLDAIIDLEHIEARDPGDRRRLAALAEEARRLKEALRTGLERRDAQARIAQLRDEIAREKLALGSQENRAGLESAVGKMGNSPALKSAARALGNGDLVEFDQEMQRLANKAEANDREVAKEALERAAKAAREKGAKSLAQALEDQRRTFEQREKRAEALRELGEALRNSLDDEGRKSLQEFNESGSPEAQRRLADALGRALNGLSDEERRRLAERLGERLKKQFGDHGAADPSDPLSPKALEDWAKRLESKEGRQALKEALRDLANADPSREAERERGLNGADRGGADAQRELGGMPIPLPGNGRDPSGRSGPPNKPGPDHQSLPEQQGQPGGSGSHHDEGRGNHQGESAPVPGDSLRSKAQAQFKSGAPLQGSSLGRTDARPGETANQLGTGVLDQAPAVDLGGVEGSEIPEEYREQVGRYFHP